MICKILRQKDPHFLSFKEWAYQKLKTKLQYYKIQKKIIRGMNIIKDCLDLKENTKILYDKIL